VLPGASSRSENWGRPNTVGWLGNFFLRGFCGPGRQDYSCSLYHARPGLWTKKGLEWLCRLHLLAASQQLRRDLLLEEIEALTRQAGRIGEHLNQQAKHSFAVVQLRSIPGVGVPTAETFAAFVDDPHRFPNARQ
jgi:transposase